MTRSLALYLVHASFVVELGPRIGIAIGTDTFCQFFFNIHTLWTKSQHLAEGGEIELLAVGDPWLFQVGMRSGARYGSGKMSQRRRNRKDELELEQTREAAHRCRGEHWDPYSAMQDCSTCIGTTHRNTQPSSTTSHPLVPLRTSPQKEPGGRNSPTSPGASQTRAAPNSLPNC
jgi:hypothetical protein